MIHEGKALEDVGSRKKKVFLILMSDQSFVAVCKEGNNLAGTQNQLVIKSQSIRDKLSTYRPTCLTQVNCPLQRYLRIVHGTSHLFYI